MLRFENLSSDSSVAWMGRAFSEIIATDLAASTGVRTLTSARLHGYDRALGPRPISAPGISTELTEAGLAGATRVVYGEYTLSNGRLEAHVTVEDPARLKMVATFTVTAPAGGVLQAAGEIARRIDTRAGSYGTRNSEAVAAYIRALESGDAARAEQSLQTAIQADPDFAPPYRMLAEQRMRQGDARGASTVIERALQRAQGLPAVERARLEVQASEVQGDLNGRQAALLKLVNAEPREVEAWRTLGEIAYARHDYRRAVEALQKAAELEPGEPATWNLLGYSAAYSGDLAAGAAALKKYGEFTPGANPLDSLGDIYFASGRLDDAEKYYLAAYQKDPNFLNQGDLLKAAMARLFTGDLAASDAAVNRYFDARAKAQDPILPERRAQWLWLTGRRKQAMEQLEAFAGTLEKSENPQARDAASRSYAELSLWKLMLGDRTAAAQFASRAVQLGSPAARGNAFVAAFIAQPPVSASEWTVRAEQVFGGPAQASIRNFALSYALLVNRDFHEASLLLKQTWESGPAVADEGLPVVLAWTLLEDGKAKEAAPLLRFNPVVNANGLTPYASFYLPRIFYLRGVLAQKEGRGDAAAEFRRFLTLSGDTPLIWGEEKKAQ